MAQRNSRRGKGKSTKNPELRTGGGRQAKAARSQERRVQTERGAPGGPVVRMRPAGAGGLVFVLLVAWLAIAAFAYLGMSFDRWNVVSYPDSLWLYVSFGVLIVAPAVGRVARSERDADAWGAQALLVPTALFVLDTVIGPSCPTGAECGSVGARGSLGIVWSIVLIATFAIGAWGLARWQHRSSAAKRPQQGRVRYGATAITMSALLVFPGLVMAAGLLGADVWLRDTPALALKALDEVERDCYGLQNAPALAVRAAPGGYHPAWTTFAVRRANEDRPGIGKDKLPTNWAELDYVHPYEATVSFTQDGQVVTVTCRRLGPGTGNAVADDLTQEDPDSNPLSPKTNGSQFLPRFFTQGVAGPTEEGKKKAAEDAKAAAAKAKADAAKEKTDAAKTNAGDDATK